MLKSKLKIIANKFLQKFGVRIVSSFEEIIIDRNKIENNNLIDIFPFAIYILSQSIDKIRFIQVGANDGITDDKFREQIKKKYNLKGIMVEPQKKAFNKLYSLYSNNSNIICENIAISTSKKPIDFFYFDKERENGYQIDVLASTYKQHLVTWKKNLKLEANIIKETVPSTTIEDLLLKYNWDGLEILIIDTEGYDYEILKTIDFKSYPPLIIQYEHKNLNNENQLNAIKLLTENNYYLLPYRLDTVALHDDVLKLLDD